MTRKRRTCRGKVRFRDHSEAVRALQRIGGPDARHQGHDGNRPVRAYPCPRCSGWHLTKRAA